MILSFSIRRGEESKIISNMYYFDNYFRVAKFAHFYKFHKFEDRWKHAKKYRCRLGDAGSNPTGSDIFSRVFVYLQIYEIQQYVLMMQAATRVSENLLLSIFPASSLSSFFSRTSLFPVIMSIYFARNYKF